MKALALSAAVLGLWTTAFAAEGEHQPLPAGLEFREIARDGIAQQGKPVARDAIEVFTYEGQPSGVRIGDKQIAVDYGQSGVLFDRGTGGFMQRFTIADGWPNRRPAEFPPPRRTFRPHLVGPGVLDSPAPDRLAPSATETVAHAPAASVEFGAAEWRAMQPAGFLSTMHQRVGNQWRKLNDRYGTWTAILRELNEASFLEATPGTRYTMRDGLAGNIITHLAVAEGKLWAACVDVYDPEKKDWGPGGLCCFDPKQGRWQRIEQIDGRPVRWVTLLENVGGALWVGFREGNGVAGDKVVYGMGLYPEAYRPVTTSVVLARLSHGAWKSFAREPVPTEDRDVYDAARPKPSPTPSTEVPRTLALAGNQVFLFSETFLRSMGNWDVDMEGHISRLDPTAGTWQTFSAGDFGAYHLDRMLGQDGEIIACTNRGAHRWLSAGKKWQLLETASPIQNPTFGAAAAVGDELWVGYTNQSFGVLGRQGISRFDENARRWSHVLPEQIGTSCPVRRIVPMPGGEVWVLFQPRPWLGAAMEFPRYPEENIAIRFPTVSQGKAAQRVAPIPGLARLAGGKWQFPVKLDGVPDSRDRKYRDDKGVERVWHEPLPIEHLVGAGGKLFVANAAGAYVGTTPWKQIAEGHIAGLESSDDGKTLLLWRDVQRDAGSPSGLERGRCDVATGVITWEKLKEMSWQDWERVRGASLLSSSGNHEWRQNWVRLPLRKPGQWAVGELDGNYHAVIETPQALWLASEGQLVRLDRAGLP